MNCYCCTKSPIFPLNSTMTMRGQIVLFQTEYTSDWRKKNWKSFNQYSSFYCVGIISTRPSVNFVNCFRSTHEFLCLTLFVRTCIRRRQQQRPASILQVDVIYIPSIWPFYSQLYCPRIGTFSVPTLNNMAKYTENSLALSDTQQWN